MLTKSSFIVMTVSMARRPSLILAIFCMLLTGCRVGSRVTEGTGSTTATQEIETEASSTGLALEDTTAAEPTVETAAIPVTNMQMDFCFAYPEGYTLVANDELVEVTGPYSGSGPEPGLVWVNAIDAQSCTAQDFANEEVAVAGLNPPRSTVMLGGEEALVLDGMPGQDALRKVYIVHGSMLYTLNFSPYRSENVTANAQMETLYTSVTSSWVWISSGTPCKADN
jgi:hypothetical protein